MTDREDDAYTNTCGTNPNDIATKQERVISKTCTHCQEGPSVFLYRRESICSACLEGTWVRKVRSNLYKSRPNRHERLSAVYGFTGSVSSVVLLDILNEALDIDRSDLYVSSSTL